MTEEKIRKNNKLIAEFMGYEFFKTPNCGIFGGNKFTKLPKKNNKPPFTVYHGWSSPNYNKYWDWLMPVVEKIETFKFKVTIRDQDCWIDIGTKEEFGAGYQGSKILSVWIAIVKFIKWYNENR
jgi:hypothetical protein